MQVKHEDYDVGVIVGRFQVHELHEAHKDLIQSVCDQHDRVLIFLGLSPVLNTANNPLDFEARKQMILDEFPNVTVLYIKDVFDDELWSRVLDNQIADMIGPNQSVVLYGGRDSFIDVYSGRYDTKELYSEVYVSGTDIRKKLTKSVKASPDFRHGVVWASANRFPTVFTTVDVAIFNRPNYTSTGGDNYVSDNSEYTKILLGRKEHEKQYRLIGGFADVNSSSFEHDARREVSEEAGVTIGDLNYLGSYNIDDWRYRAEVDGIRTILFGAIVSQGGPRPGDDIHELKWFDVDALWNETHDGFSFKQVVPQHHEILKVALEYAKDKRETLTKG